MKSGRIRGFSENGFLDLYTVTVSVKALKDTVVTVILT